jgi:hypothetical protein
MMRSIDMKITALSKSININLVVTIVAGLLFLAIPSASTGILMITDNLLVRGALIAAVIGALYVDMFLAILVFLVVARIFLERNNRKLLEAKAVITNNSVRVDTILPDEKGEIADSEARVDRTVYSPEQATDSGLDFLSTDESGDNTFSPIGVNSINSKSVLQSTVEGSAAASRVFGDQIINPDISNNSA